MNYTIYKKKKDWTLFFEIYSSTTLLILKKKKDGVIKIEKDDGEDTPFQDYINNKYEKM